MFDFGWTWDTQQTKQIKLPSEDSQSENIFPLPSCAASETSIELELDSDNSEEYSTSSKTDEGTQNPSEEEGDLGEKDGDILNSGETLINIDELLMKDSISQSELRTAISSGPDSSRQTCYSYPTDEDGNAFPISIFARQQSNGERVKRDWLRWNCKGEALHCFSCPLFSTPPGPSNQVFQSRKAVLSGRNSMIK